jgi:hypothetical protein
MKSTATNTDTNVFVIRLHNVPPILQTSLKNYLNFFREYCRAVLGSSILVNSEVLNNGEMHVRVEVETSEMSTSVQAELPCYMAHLLRDSPPELRREIRSHEAELFLVLWRRALADIRTDIRFHFGMLSQEEQRALAVILLTLSFGEGAAMLELNEGSIAEYMENLNALKMPSEQQELPERFRPMMLSSLPTSVAESGFVTENPFCTSLQLAAVLDVFPYPVQHMECEAVRSLLTDLASHLTDKHALSHNRLRVTALQSWFFGLVSDGDTRAAHLFGEAAHELQARWAAIVW